MKDKKRNREVDDLFDLMNEEDPFSKREVKRLKVDNEPKKV